MKINNVLSVFAPKDVKFLPLLEETAVVLVQSSVLLQNLFSSTNEEQVRDLCKLIKAEEIKGDKSTGRIFKALNDTFITPFDREDVHALADVMDDVIDAINRSAQKVVLYSPHRLPACTLQLADVIHLGALEIQGAVAELSQLKKRTLRLNQHCKEIKRLEELADAIYEEGIINIFKEETSTVELIKLKEIIQELEKSANKLNSTAKILKTILVKYA